MRIQAPAQATLTCRPHSFCVRRHNGSPSFHLYFLASSVPARRAALQFPTIFVLAQFDVA